MARMTDKSETLISSIETLESKISESNKPDQDAILSRIESIAYKAISETMKWIRINYKIHSAYHAGNHELGNRSCEKTIKQMRSDKGNAKTIGQVSKNQAIQSHRFDLDNTFTENEYLEKITVIRKSDKKVISKGLRLKPSYLTGTSQNHIESRQYGEGQDGYQSGIVEYLQSTANRIGWKEWTESTDSLDFVPFMPVRDNLGVIIGLVPVGAPRLTYGWLRLGCRRVTDSSKNWKRAPKDISAYKLRRHWEFTESTELPESIESKPVQTQPIKVEYSIGEIKNEIKAMPSESKRERRMKEVMLMVADGYRLDDIARVTGLHCGSVRKEISVFRMKNPDLKNKVIDRVLIET